MHASYYSAIVLSTAKNFIMTSDSTFTHSYRTYIKPREYGKLKMKFWCSNNVDSTWADGSDSRANLQGGSWRIEAANIADGGKLPDGSVVSGTQVPLTYDSSFSKLVIPGEMFWSDALTFTIPEGNYLAFTWTITSMAAGHSFPFNTEGLLVSAYDAPGHAAVQASSDLYRKSVNCLVLPDFVGYERACAKRIAFLGDSITQGVRTRLDAYEYWAARIAEGLGHSTSVWNIGSGWARAYDAASDGAWLYKVKQSDKVVIALGVNDIGTAGRTAAQVLDDLQTIVAKLKQDNAAKTVILCTVPTFNFTDSQELTWRQVNDSIRQHAILGADRVFDMAEVLSQLAPNDNLLKPAYMASGSDPHPNGEAGLAIADAFLSWYGNNC